MLCSLLCLRRRAPGLDRAGAEMWGKNQDFWTGPNHKFHKIVNEFNFEVLKEKIWANLHRIIELFHKKIVKKLLNYGLGIRKKPIPGPVSRGQKGTGSWIPDPDPQYCFQLPASLPPLH